MSVCLYMMFSKARGGQLFVWNGSYTVMHRCVGESKPWSSASVTLLLTIEPPASFLVSL